jgi:hypothetical protein
MSQKDQIPTYEFAIEALYNGNKEILEKCLLKFEIDDGNYVEQVTKAVRALLERPDLSPRQIVSIGRALHGLGRLPLRTPGLDIHIALVINNTSGGETYELFFRDDHFITTSGGFVDFGQGSDSFTGTTFSVEKGYRDLEGWHFGAPEWPDMFSQMQGAELKIEDGSEDKLLDWEHPDGSAFWDWIAKHD